MATETLLSIRERIIPMLQYIAAEYKYRVPEGYPSIVDTPELGVVGLELDPNYSLNFVSDGERVWADVNYRSPRLDKGSTAGWQKYAGEPVDDRRPVDPSISDQGLRNLIAELISRWNFQPLILWITDTD